jgi:hypothetical protein
VCAGGSALTSIGQACAQAHELPVTVPFLLQENDFDRLVLQYAPSA